MGRRGQNDMSLKSKILVIKALSILERVLGYAKKKKPNSDMSPRLTSEFTTVPQRALTIPAKRHICQNMEASHFTQKQCKAVCICGPPARCMLHALTKSSHAKKSHVHSWSLICSVPEWTQICTHQYYHAILYTPSKHPLENHA